MRKNRIRRRKVEIQIQECLNDAATAMTADISVQKLVQTRLSCLLKLQARERNDKIQRLTQEVTALKAEVERLTDASLKSLKPATARPLSTAEQALAQYEKGKRPVMTVWTSL